jgi:hypothetical protein
MSRIHFDSPSGGRDVSGTERADMRLTLTDVAHAVLTVGYVLDWLPGFLPADAYPLRQLEPRFGSDPRFRGSLRSWIDDERHHFLVGGELYNARQLGLNTVLAIGSDPLKLYARLHGQCEIHCWVEGPNREWLAGLIRRGVAAGLYRDRGYRPREGKTPLPARWTPLADWLESDAAEPVVCSYSVCRRFPDPDVAGWPEESLEDWDRLPATERWARALEGLRRDRPLLELRPEGWESYRFGHGKDAFWLREQAP